MRLAGQLDQRLVEPLHHGGGCEQGSHAPRRSYPLAGANVARQFLSSVALFTPSLDINTQPPISCRLRKEFPPPDADSRCHKGPVVKIFRSVFSPESMASSWGFAYLPQTVPPYVQSCQTIGRRSCDTAHTRDSVHRSSAASESL